MAKKARKERRDVGIPEFGYMPNPGKSLIREIRKAKRLGADYVEIPAETGHHPSILLKRKKIIRHELEKQRLGAVIHMAYWADLGSEYDAVRKGWVEECKKAIDAAGNIGATKLLVHIRPQSGMSMRVPKNRKAIISSIIKSLNTLSAYAKKKGVPMVAENEDIGHEKSISIQDIKRIMSKAKGTGFAPDMAHAFLGNSNKKVKELIRGLGSRIEHCHFSDNHGYEDEHLPIGRGSIDYKMVVRELKRTGYGRHGNNTITLEVFNSDKGFKSSMKKIKKMWGS